MSVKTEESILQEVSEHIKRATRSNNQQVDEIQKNNIELNIIEDGKIDDKEDHKAKLQKQVEIGEITPFEAISKQSILEQKERYNIYHIYIYI